MDEFISEKKLKEATTMRRKGSDGGRMAAPTKEIKQKHINKKLKNEEKKNNNKFTAPFK